MIFANSANSHHDIQLIPSTADSHHDMQIENFFFKFGVEYHALGKKRLLLDRGPRG